jgi:CDP-diacylglycerol--glycerol-3-phosphate 3-phosphatidyltransferase
LDPLTDKVLTCSAFIYLATVATTGIAVWMAAVIVGRELLVTGLRGMVESVGAAFGADWGGKIKTISQFVVLIGVLLQQGLEQQQWEAAARALQTPLKVLIVAMIIATVVSGGHYLVKAARLMESMPQP